MLDKKIINSSLIYVITKYFNLFLGFLRTTFVAITLSKNNMGELVIIYLLLEYSSYLFSMGAPNSINLQSSIDKNHTKNLNSDNHKIKKYYSIFFFIIYFSSAIFYSLLYISSNYFDEYIKETISNNYNKIFFLIFLYAIHAFCNMHNRLWERRNPLIISEISFAVIYLAGVYFFLKDGSDSVSIILKIAIVAQIVSIILSNVKLSYFHFLTFDKSVFKELAPLGILLMLQNLMELYFWGIDRLFISFYLEPSNLASFHIAHTYGRGLMMFFTSFTFLIYPRLLTTLSSTKTSNEEIQRVITKAFSISEIILVSAFIFYTASIPYLINFMLVKYDNFFYIFSLVLFGLIIKSITFFPVSLIISRKKQKKLILSSFIFLIILILLYNLTTQSKFTKAEDYTSIAIVIFLIFSIYIYTWSLFILEKKRKFFEVVLKFWRLTIIFIILYSCYSYDISQIHTIFILTSFSLIIYYNRIFTDIKIVYLRVMELRKG